MQMLYLMRRAAAVALALAAMAATTAVLAVTPSGGWTLQEPSPNVRDYHFRIDVDPGAAYPDPGYARSFVYWAQYLQFENTEDIGYLGIQRNPNQGTAKKSVLASIWNASDAKGGAIPAVYCHEFWPCQSIHGEYEWFVGHVYRFRMELSPRTPSDSEGNWWMFTLTDLTMNTKEILGELKTPKAWGGLRKETYVFLEYIGGQDTCDALRYNKVTQAPIAGNYGEAKALAFATNYTYGDPHQCAAEYILTDMHPNDYSSLSLLGEGNSFILIGNTYRELHKYGQFQKTAKAGMMFAMDPDSENPYMYRAAHDGAYTTAFPPQGQDNADWISVGKGLPIINDLFFRQQRLYSWEERQASYVREGDFFYQEHPFNGDYEYFALTKKEGAWYFPIVKVHNEHWQYIGRTPKKTDDLAAELRVHSKDVWVNPVLRWVYHSVEHDGDAYYILREKASYAPFPDRSNGEMDNQWWQYAGNKP